MGCVKKSFRKKVLGPDTGETTQLRRCLRVWDLYLLGVGSMVGSGIYAISGVAAKLQAGPGIVLSFCIASVVIFLSAISYMELATRVSRTGSTYLFTYMSLGEFPAFSLGWAMLLAILAGGATNARAWSSYLDFLLHNQITKFTDRYIGNWLHCPNSSSINMSIYTNLEDGNSTSGNETLSTVSTNETLPDITIAACYEIVPLAERPDLVGAAVVLVLTGVVAAGAKCSSRFNGIFAVLNIAILLFVTIIGFVYADTSNWTSKESGGFLPFGFQGVLTGAGAAFWAFTGFEIIPVSVEEAKNPKRSIPLALVLALLTVLFLYVGTSASITLMTLYSSIDEEAPLPSAFKEKGIYWAMYIVSAGPLLGLTTTLFGCLFGFARMTYAMAYDGLLPKACATVNARTNIPLLPAIIGGVATSFLALTLDLAHIISFGISLALLQYVVVDVCVLVFRYTPDGDEIRSRLPLKLHNGPPLQWKINKYRSLSDDNGSLNNLLDDTESNHSAASSDNIEPQDSVSQMSDTPGGVLARTNSNDSLQDLPQDATRSTPTGMLRPAFRWLRCLCCCSCVCGRCVSVCVALLCASSAGLAGCIVYLKPLTGSWVDISLFVAAALSWLFLQIVIYAHQQNPAKVALKVPLVPWLPSVAMLTCFILLIATATWTSWIGMVLVMSSGVVLYYTYGYRNSHLHHQPADVTVQHIRGDAVALLNSESEDEF